MQREYGAVENKKYRISGYDSLLAKQNPEVAEAIDAAGKDKSNLCYECIKLAMRNIGIYPKTRSEIHDFLTIVHTFNKYGVIPGVNIAEAKLKEINGKIDVQNHTGALHANINQVKWSNPDMEEEFI